MIRLIFPKIVVFLTMAAAGSLAMEPPNTDSATTFTNQEVCVESLTMQPETTVIAISQERVADILQCLQRNYWGLTLTLSELESFLLPDSILPNDMRGSILQGIPDATGEEIRCALEGIYSRNRKMEILDCLVLKCKLHHLPLFELESLFDSNTPLPEDIKAVVWKTIPDATEEEMRLQIKLIHLDKKKPSLKLC